METREELVADCGEKDGHAANTLCQSDLREPLARRSPGHQARLSRVDSPIWRLQARHQVVDLATRARRQGEGHCRTHRHKRV